MAYLNLYLDDCVYSKRLHQMLLQAGHHVVTPFEAGIAGADDIAHFAYACQHQLVILTKDTNDFEELHQEKNQHYGILAIYEGTDYSKNMSYANVVRAIGNLASANVPLLGRFYVLNHWHW